MGERLFLAATFVILAATASASAGLSLKIESLPVMGGFIYPYDVRLVADSDGDIVRQWDGAFSGPMIQVMAQGQLPTPTMTNAGRLSAMDAAVDSHFSLCDSELTLVRAPSENILSLDGAFGVTASAQSGDLGLAHLGIAFEDTVHFGGTVLSEAGAEFRVSGAITGGLEGLGLAVQGADSNHDGGLDYFLGQPIPIFGTASPGMEYQVWHHFQAEGLSVAGLVVSTQEPTFTFTPAEPGEYWVGIERKIDDSWGTGPDSIRITVLPEPATLGLMLVATVGLRRRR